MEPPGPTSAFLYMQPDFSTSQPLRHNGMEQQAQLQVNCCKTSAAEVVQQFTCSCQASAQLQNSHHVGLCQPGAAPIPPTGCQADGTSLLRQPQDSNRTPGPRACMHSHNQQALPAASLADLHSCLHIHRIQLACKARQHLRKLHLLQQAASVWMAGSREAQQQPLQGRRPHMACKFGRCDTPCFVRRQS